MKHPFRLLSALLLILCAFPLHAQRDAVITTVLNESMEVEIQSFRSSRVYYRDPSIPDARDRYFPQTYIDNIRFPDGCTVRFRDGELLLPDAGETSGRDLDYHAGELYLEEVIKLRRDDVVKLLGDVPDMAKYDWGRFECGIGMLGIFGGASLLLIPAAVGVMYAAGERIVGFPDSILTIAVLSVPGCLVTGVSGLVLLRGKKNLKGFAQAHSSPAESFGGDVTLRMGVTRSGGYGLVLNF